MLIIGDVQNCLSQWKWASYFVLLISVLLVLLPQAHAAELTVRFLDGRAIDSMLEGEIQPGDYDSFVAKIQNGGLGTTLWLNSPGGNVYEALKIGRLVRALRMDTHAPDRAGGKTFCLTHPKGAGLDKCNCASACFLIFVAGINRNGNHLGIHRVFNNPDQLRLMSPDDAAITTGKATNVVSAYLIEMGVPTHFIERLMVIPSNKIEWVSPEDISHYFSGYIPQYSEWVAAKCKSNQSLYEEAIPIIQKQKRQRLTAVEEERLSRISGEVEENAICAVSAAKEIRRDAEAKVITKLQSQKQ
jgi:hypothetical protein